VTFDGAAHGPGFPRGADAAWTTEPAMGTENPLTESRRSGDTVLVSVTGDLAYETAGQVRPQLRATVAGGCRRLVLDVSNLHFLDSTGLSVLVWLRLRLERLGGRLELRGLRGQPARFLATTGTTGLFHARGTGTGGGAGQPFAAAG
jgi:anti-anti-sigma factor